MKYIPQIEPWIDGLELKHLAQVIQSTFITENQKTEEFLERVREFAGARYAIAVSNGTLALVACLLSEGIGSGDTVIVPNLTFIATANAVRLVGATPVFCDVTEETGCIDTTECERLITKRTRAVIPVHLYGLAADMASLTDIASRYDFCVIEDAAESFGITIDGKHTGTFGNYGVFSFFANKVITCGEGGVVLTDNELRYKKLYRIKNHGRDRRGTFVHESIGYNFCFTDLQAAVGVAQFEKLGQILERKKRNFQRYKEALSDLPDVSVVTPPPNIKSNYWFVNILVNDPEALSVHLNAAGIGTRRFFYPLHLQPCFSNMPKEGSYLVSEKLYKHGLSLPSSSRLSDEQLDYICNAIDIFYNKKKAINM